MTSVSGRAPARRRARRPLPAMWLPRQHGAWAMLAVPFLAGVLVSGGHWRQLPLGLCWLAAYLAFHAVGLWLRSGRRTRFRPAVLVYGAITAALGLLVVFTAPGLLVWLPAFAVLAAASWWFSTHRQDRALRNDALTLLAACLFTLVTYQAAYDGPAAALASPDAPQALAVAVLCFGYFLGTALYVKTLIRERRSVAYHRASFWYHLGWTVAWAVTGLWPPPGVGAMGWPVAAFFAVLTVRAAVMAGRRVSPRYVGYGEIAASVVLLLLVVWWQ